jgi:Holliday junction DNA helicase RuvB
MSERFITSTLNKKDNDRENGLRPLSFSEFPGQERIKDILALTVHAARERGEPPAHLLLSGPPGLGKTTLAHIVGAELGCNVKTSSGPAIEKPGDLAGLLTGMSAGDILFIDEIHRLSTTVEEYLYSAMEDFFIDIVLEQGPGARSVRLNVPKFTLIGATTRQGMLSAPLRARFGLNLRLDYYQPEVLEQILVRSARIMDVKLEPEGAREIAIRSRGTPRIANNLLAWARNYAIVKTGGVISGESARAALGMFRIDADGLDEMDLRILETVVKNFHGGPAGLKTIAVVVGESEDTIEEAYEPFLIREGYLVRTSRGRMATAKSWERFGLTPPASGLPEKDQYPDLFESQQ